MSKKVVSLYSGAGGMDLGFKLEGFDVVWANDMDKDACKTYSENIGPHIRQGDVNNFFSELSALRGQVSVLIGGPPCQGFSVAGKGDKGDYRNQNLWTYTKVIELLEPEVFIMENVKALGAFKKWDSLKISLLEKMRSLGYAVNYTILTASDFNVPQKRERIIFVGFKTDKSIIPDLNSMFKSYQLKSKSVKKVLSALNKAGTGNNKGVSPYGIVLAKNPLVDKTHFGGMLFNGRGRPVNLKGYAPTITSFGGNMIPFIDEEELYNGKQSWMEKYHASLVNNTLSSDIKQVPSSVRRLTLEELGLIQTFPSTFVFSGHYSSKVRQIGNAVPCEMARRIAKMVNNYLK